MEHIIFILAFCSIITLSLGIQEGKLPPSTRISIEQINAFAVLQAKCNVCHKTKNPSKLFTLENMNGFAKKINRQVFIYKRMPKSNKIRLTTAEKKTLKTWINNQTK